jgi:hypothetical protein
VIETRTALPAGYVRDLTAAIRRHVLDPDGRPGGDGEPVSRVLDRCPDPQRRRELAGLVARIDTLEPAQRRGFVEAIDGVQVPSKLWLLAELASRHHLPGTTMVVLGAWYGILPLLCHWRLDRPPARTLCIDFDPRACAVGERVIAATYPSVTYQVADIMDLDYPALLEPGGSVLVNTICEHLPDLPGWWTRVPTGTLAVLQSNNYRGCPDHVNCVDSVTDMQIQTPLAEVLYEGTLPVPGMDRYMLIGYR